ncbi:MAG: hypothetical protein H0X36_09270 [Sphingomonadaceae bacterium]|nr:hypothetical protein [Sphingomonadaceae bacterium]
MDAGGRGSSRGGWRDGAIHRRRLGDRRVDGGDAFYRRTAIVGTRGANIAAPAGGATVDSEARAAIGALIVQLASHGLIALTTRGTDPPSSLFSR